MFNKIYINNSELMIFMVLQVIDEKALKRKNDLKFYRGWLPFQFTAYISLYDRKQFLQSIGLWDEVQQKNLEVKKGIRDNKPNDLQYLDKLLKAWLVDNPKFADLVTEIEI